MGSRLMDKIDFCLIPFIYLFQLTLTILNVATFFVPTPSTIGRALKNILTWTTIFSLHLILFILSVLHSFVQIIIINIPLNTVHQLSIVHYYLYRKQYYLSLFKHNSNISLFWKILTNPVLLEGVTKSHKPSILLFVLIKTFSVTPSTRFKERTST